MSDVVSEIRTETSRIEIDALYTSKGHFNAAMLWNLVHYGLGIVAVLLGAVAGKEFWEINSPVGTLFAGSAAAITAAITFLKPSERAQPHQSCGAALGVASGSGIFKRDRT